MARKLLFPLLLLISLGSLKAQSLLNGSFEDTTITVNDTVPRYWSTDFFGFGFTTDAHSGNQAAEIWNWYSYAKGWIVYGAALDPYQGGGQPININPDKLTGFYKYIYGSNGGAADSAICEILIYSHQNFTGARDTVAHVTYKLGPQPEYSAFEVPIDYIHSGLAADTIIVRFLSSETGFCNPTNECLYLYLDDLEVSAVVGVSQPMDLLPSCHLYPSPSAGGFRIIESQSPSIYPATVLLQDLSGREVYSTTIIGPSSQEIQPHLPAGNYLWTIIGNSGKKFSGKWQCQ